MTAVSYPEWLHAQIAELQRQRRRAQWRRYAASDKGRERTGRYIASDKGRATREHWAAEHPFQVLLLYPARYAVKQARARRRLLDEVYA